MVFSVQVYGPPGSHLPTEPLFNSEFDGSHRVDDPVALDRSEA